MGGMSSRVRLLAFVGSRITPSAWAYPECSVTVSNDNRRNGPLIFYHWRWLVRNVFAPSSESSLVGASSKLILQTSLPQTDGHLQTQSHFRSVGKLRTMHLALRARMVSRLPQTHFWVSPCSHPPSSSLTGVTWVHRRQYSGRYNRSCQPSPPFCSSRPLPWVREKPPKLSLSCSVSQRARAHTDTSQQHAHSPFFSPRNPSCVTRTTIIRRPVAN